MNTLEKSKTHRLDHHAIVQNDVTLDIEIQSMDAVLDIVTTLGRVGATIVSIHAGCCQVRVTFHAGGLVTRRLPKLLETIVPVMSVTIMDANTIAGNETFILPRH